MIGRRATPEIHRRLCHGHGHGADKARIEGGGDDVFAAIAQALAIDLGDRVGHVGAGQLRDGVGRGDLHRLVDGARLNVERSAEDIGEAQHVVDLVGIIRAAGRHDGIVADLGDLLRRDLWIGVRHGEDDRLIRHARDHLLGHGARGGKAVEHVGAPQRLFERARPGVDRVRRFPLVHALLASAIDHARGVAQDHVLMPDADRLHQLDASDARRARAIADHPHIGQFPAGELHRVDEAGGRDDRRAVLIVVEDGDVHQLAEPAFDDEALGRLDVFQINAAKGRSEITHGVDKLVRVLRVDFEVDGIDIGEALEQGRLAFHHRLRGKGAEIAEPQNGRAVGDHRDEVALDRVVVGKARVFRDGFYWNGHTRRVSKAQVALGRHRLGRHDLLACRAFLQRGIAAPPGARILGRRRGGVLPLPRFRKWP